MYLFIRAIELEILTALLDLFVLHSLGRRLHLLREILGVHLHGPTCMEDVLTISNLLE